MSISTSTADDGIARITLDDGKANAMDREVFAALNDALDEVADARAVVVVGRPGMFSAGLNTKVLAGISPGDFEALLLDFGRTMLRVWTHPRPVVAAATGHALAGGTILAMACDHAVAARGEFAWGLTETTIGFPMPEWILTIARGNVRNDRLDDLVLPGRMVGPDEAVEVGFADAAAEPDDVVDAALGRARELAELPAPTYAMTKAKLRGAAAEAARARMAEDLRGLLGGIAG